MKTKGYTAYALITSLLEEAALVAVVLWLLPRWGINIPLWGLVFMMAALGACEYTIYRLGKKALDKKPMVTPDIGSRCRAATPLTPRGYVKVGNELWEASSTGSTIDKDAEAVIVGIEGLTLFVASLHSDEHISHDT